jgi:son of sevenless
MHDYSSMSAIVTALSSNVISKLYLTWGHAKRDIHLEAMVKLNEPAGNFRAFRQAQKPSDGPCVPFLGPYLSDIIHVHDHYHDTTAHTSKGSKPLLNFIKRRKWTVILDAMFCHQGKSYTHPEDPAVVQQIKTGLTLASAIDQAAFWTKSDEVQQAERASADLRKGLEAAGF